MNTSEQDGQVSAPLRYAYGILQELTDELERELDFVLKVDQQNPDEIRMEIFSQVDRRILVRSIFSYIEAVTFATKALVLSDPHSSKLAEGERMLASEINYELKSTGDVSIRPAKISLASNIRFTFKIFSKVFGSWTPLDTRGHEWECVQRSIKVRDRITHPKRATDLFITDAEVDEAHRAIIWFYKSCIRASLEFFAAQHDTAKKLEATLEQIIREQNHMPAEARQRIEELLKKPPSIEIPKELVSIADKLIEKRDQLMGREINRPVDERSHT